MRVPLSWLKEYVAIDLPIPALAELMTNAGLEVETIDYIGIEGAELVWEREKVLLGRLLRVEQHPDADRLILATVDYGGSAPKVVVTGAPNLFQYLGSGDLTDRGLYGAIIFEGATYLDPYKDGKPTTLKGRPLRGIYNDAMLCSQAELGLGADHDGVIIMRAGPLAPPYVPGTPLQDVLGDAVLDIAILPNIARCTSILGVAREVAALTNQPLREPNTAVLMEGAPIGRRVKITTAAPELNPRFVALLIEGVEQKPAPFWMQHRLRLAGLRPINVVVDVSNYVMLEIGQPNHTFDYDFLRRRADEYDPAGPIHIITRLAQPGETLTTLDGKRHELHPNNILVTDPAGNLSLGGIMGGEESEIRPETTNVLLEAAAWQFINIRHSQRQLGINTDAGFRFSRGVHPSQALLGAKRAAELLRVLAGGTVAEGIVDYYPNPAPPVTVRLTQEYASKLSGLALSPAEMAALLARAGFTIEAIEADALVVTAPDYRLDIEGPHDLVEEICRIYGYENIPSTVLASMLPPQRGNRPYELEERIKETLVRLGLYEIITYRMTTAAAEQRAVTGRPDDRPYVTIVNPSTLDRVQMRHSLLASVLEIVAANTRFADRIALFEIGHIYIKAEGQQLPDELPRLVLALTGLRHAEHWQNGTPPTLDFFDLKGIVEGLLAELHVPVSYAAGEHPSYRPGRTARILLGNSQKQLGVLGELHPRVVEQYDMRLDRNQPVLAAELALDVLLDRIPDHVLVPPLPVYPAVREDLALVVPAVTPAADVTAALRAAGGALLRDVALFDVYTGDKIGAGKKSLAYHLTFQASDKTLKDRDVQKLRERIIRALEAQIGAQLRD